MKLMIAGSRGITDFDLSPYIPEETTLIIAGGAAGIDTLAEQYADAHKFSKLILRPRYALYGRAAPLKRNEQMVALADLIVVVWDGRSKGSQHTIEYAKKQGKEVVVVFYNDRKSKSP